MAGQKTCEQCGALFKNTPTSWLCVPCRKLRDKERKTKWATANASLVAERRKAWELAHPERVREIKKRWERANRERKGEASKKWAKSNPDRVRDNRQNWRKINPERVKELAKKYRDADPGKLRVQQKASRDRNRARLRISAAEYARNHPEQRAASERARKAKKLKAGGHHTAKDIAEIFQSQRGRCAYCRIGLPRRGYHVDHIRALSRGGSNARSNLQILCAPCNTSKHTADPIDFAQSKGLLI